MMTNAPPLKISIESRLRVFSQAMLTALLLLLTTSQSFAATDELSTSQYRPIHIEQAANIDISYSVYLYHDNDLDWQSVSNLPLSPEHLNLGGFFSVDEFVMPLWMRADITTGQLDPNDDWLLGLGNGFGGDLILYVISDKQLIDTINLSSKKTFSERPHPNRFVHFPLKLPSNAQIQLLLKINSAPIPFFLPKLTTEALLAESERPQIAWFGFAYGLLATLMIYHLVLAIATQEKSYLIYSLYLFSACFWVGIYNGLTFKFIWPNTPWIEELLGIVMYYSPVYVGILFTVQFLKLPSISKRLTLFYSGISIWLIVLIGMRVIFSTTNIVLLSLTTAIVYFSFIYAGFYALRKGVVYAKYYLVAWTIYCLSIVNFMLVASRLPALFPEYSYWLTIIAFDIQAMLLAAALAHRIRTIRQSALEAEAGNRAKSEFLARMSHEIRTPLSGVLGMAELLADRLTDKTNIYYTNIIRSSGTSLLTVINDILDFSKFSSGKMELEKIPLNLQRLAVDSLDVFKVKAAEKNIELIADLNFDLPPLVMGDPTRIKQIILNFIGNAIKFTTEGQIVLSINPVSGQKDIFKIAVSDSGIGINQEEQEELFEAFTQASKSTAREHGGTGLGLSICKQLALLMGGTIGVDSESGKGSTFWIKINLPKSETVTKTIKDFNDISLKGFNVLIVEDNYTYAELLQTQTTTWGMNCSVAKNGHEALSLLKEKYNQGIHFDLISLDLVMPKIDGLETSRQIQADERFRDIPRLLLTSATNFPAQHAIESAGIKRVIEKPTIPADLQQAYKELLAKETEKADDTVIDTHVESLTLPRLSILVAEDNSVNQIVIKGILKRLNQTVVIVDNGKKAVDSVQKGDIKYDLILMDCDMPVMNGKTATQQIRKWEHTNNRAPIVIAALSAHAVQNQIDECFAAGMDKYLTKPIDIAKLEELIKEFSTSQA